MACGGGGGGRGKRGRPKEKDIWDVEGGYMGMKKAKLLEQYSEQAKGEEKEAGIFRGVSVFVNGWTNPSADEIKRLMMTHDGVFHHYYNSHTTTHIIATNLPDVKVRALKGNETICKPEWITDSIANGKLLDYTKYLLYTHQTKQQPKISFKPATKENESADASLESTEKPSPSKWLAKDATDSRFLGEFFSNSRLHHIATMGANAKDYVGELRAQHGGTFEARQNLVEIFDTADHVDKTVMHIDMDCFFVSVGLRNRPELIGRPVVVTHAKGNKPSKGTEEDAAATERRKAELQKYQERLDSRTGVRVDGDRNSSNWKLENIEGTSSMSEIASCSYEARAKGVKNGMFLGPALKLCPDLVPIPYDFPGYEEVSKILYDTVASYTLDIQAVSCDEMFVDLTSLCKDKSMDPLLFVAKLREEIKSKTGCNCSVGLGPNILLSRLATKKAKPDGQFLLTMDIAQDILAELKVTDLPGVGRSMERKLAGLGVETVQQLLGLTVGKLQQEVGGKTGQQLYNMARGKDDRKLELEHVRKTVSAEVNYGIRFTSWEDAEKFLEQLSGEVSNRMGKIRMLGRCVTLKLMVRAENAPEETAKFNGHGVCDNISKSTQLNTATDSKDVILKEVLALVKASSVEPKEMRGLGITMSKLEQVDAGKAGLNNSILKFIQKDARPLISEKENNPPVPNSRKSSSNLSLIETDEIDQEFMDSLPLDIRAEVEAQLKGRKPSVSRKESKEKSKNPFLLQVIKKGAKVNNESSESKTNSLDPEVLDPEVLNQLPPEIRAEVVDRFQNGQQKSKPVQVDLHDLPPGPSNRVINEPLPSNSPTSAINPSHLELDPAFLDQLPPDIRAEVEAEYRNQNTSNPTPISTPPKRKPDPPDEDENSCDISFSQVDQDVLSELPADVQAELRKHYNKQEKKPRGIQTKTAFDAIMKSSPNKTSPTKIAKGKRGRKKGSVNASKGSKSGNPTKSPKKLGSKSGNPTKSPKKLVKREFENNLDIEDNNSVDMEVLNALPASIRAEVEFQMKSNAAITNLKAKSISSKQKVSTSKQQASTSRVLFEDSNSNSEPAWVPEAKVDKEPETLKVDATTSLESEKNGPPSFCGKTSVSEIRPLLKEWIATSAIPLLEDVQMLSDFFKDLIHNWKIDLVQILLKCLFRNIGKLDSNKSLLWREAWENLVQKVQTVMIQNYGNPLYITDSF
eukprot:GFUD01021166.1.p1 GENE.GFUD01021166.1~~GFUD01021166.1.p1  ORF type:complete len:1198 (-),score=318.87 GFUD01021166.1:3570-7163(-)